MNIEKFEKLVCGAIVAIISIASIITGMYFTYLVLYYSFN